LVITDEDIGMFSCASVTDVDAAAAIAELRELSTQIESVVVAPRSGPPIASSVPDDDSERMLVSARALAEGADQVRRDLGRDALAQLQAATPDGSVFVVVDGERMAVATTGADPTVGLVFYDLKTLLRQLAQDDHGADEDAPA
jgi:predicted regulator of Ras-like GTPase activity (Roadblock/LC7/MglB family)